MPSLILASASKSRADLLRNAGVDFNAIASDVDENRIKDKGLAIEETASTLAIEKAMFLSKQHPDAFVIGADQMMQCEGHRFDKPTSLENAKEHLRFLRNKSHELISAVCVVQNQQVVFKDMDKAVLFMRDFSDDFLEMYVDERKEDILSTVGCYRLEEKGVQLFSKIDGNFFTILACLCYLCLNF